MDYKEKINLISEIMEIEADKLNPEVELDGLDEWDSVTRLSVIVMLEENFNKTVLGDEVRGMHTIKDILDQMQE